MKKLLILFTCICGSIVGVAQYNMQAKLTATGLQGTPYFGNSADIDANADFAIVGAPGTTGDAGAAVIFHRYGSNWVQEAILVGSGAISGANQGLSVAISADGATAVVGGPNDNNGIGAAWVFVRSGTSWSQQAKLVGTGNTGAGVQGYSVDVSADGNHIVIGAPFDNNSQGAAWIFDRLGNNWTQNGGKMVGSGVLSSVGSRQGISVAISAEGNTVAWGGFKDNVYSGAVWIFGNNGGWTQQAKFTAGQMSYLGTSVALSANGQKVLMGASRLNNYDGGVYYGRLDGSTWVYGNNSTAMQGTLAVGHAQQGTAVAISGNGSTGLIGGAASFTSGGDVGLGATWVFEANGDNYVQIGNKLVGINNIGNCQQGASLAITPDASTFITGGFGDDNGKGAVWLFSKTIPTGIEQMSASSLRIYPNPATDYITIASEQTFGKDAIVTITDQLGRIVHKQSLDASLSEQNIGVSLLAPGIYTIGVSAEHEISQQLFVKQ